MSGPSYEEIITALEAAPPKDESNGYDTRRLVELDPALGHVSVRDQTIGAPAGEIVVRSYLPVTGTPSAGLVWAHGGAWVGGSIDMPEANWVGLALAASDVAVFSVDYRRALHGVTFPVPSDDVRAAFEWVQAHRIDLGLGEARVHLGGASAGGNLAAGVAKRLSQEGSPPASLVLAYPAIHGELLAPSADLAAALQRAEVSEVDRALVAIAMRHFAGQAGVEDEIAFPGNGAVPTGHPPTLILNADADPLRASGEQYAQQLQDAGVRVDVSHFPGSAHGYLNEPESTFGGVAIDRIRDWVDH